MKDKLKLSDIISYFPYGLKCMSNAGNQGHVIGCHTDGSNTDEYRNLVRIRWIEEDIDYPLPLCNVKPILRPMSDLGKPIIINGYNHNREFIPIEKLARVYEHPWEIVEVFDIKTSKDSTLIEYTMEDVLTYRFAYIHTIDCFFNYCCYTKTEHTITNTSLLYNLLNRWHFDYHGLIERGLAVDINTINELHKI